jgi:hypothetical protein
VIKDNEPIIDNAALWEIEWLRKHAAETVVMGGGTPLVVGNAHTPSPPRDTRRPAGRPLLKHAVRSMIPSRRSNRAGRFR